VARENAVHREVIHFRIGLPQVRSHLTHGPENLGNAGLSPHTGGL